ncbi:nucleotide-binding domain-containing protein [Pseudomonas syringae]|nr:hypothetical protein [Pseudomonas syringae]
MDSGHHQITEYSTFQGGRYVGCYAVKDNACAARSRIIVPI